MSRMLLIAALVIGAAAFAGCRGSRAADVQVAPRCVCQCTGPNCSMPT